MASRIVSLLAVVLVTACSSSSPPRGLFGPYRFDDGRIVSIGPSADNTLRYREYATGESRRLYPDGELRYVAGPGFSEKEPVEVVVEFDLDERGRATRTRWTSNGEERTAKRVGIDRWVGFEHDGIDFHARLASPSGKGPHPAVVLIHGSGKEPGTDWLYASDFFVANGIAALTYDKRGTGGTGGDFTMDFQVLAGDVVAAVECLKTYDDIDALRIGVSGYSQGGWIGPLAASMSADIRYVIVNYGMVESPAVEARLETRQLLRRRGVEEKYMGDVDRLVNAGIKVIASRLTDGWDEFDATYTEFSDAPWIDKLDGSAIDGLKKYPRWLIKLFGKRKLPPGLNWYYDSTDVMQNLSTPSVWLLGERDESAPNLYTIPALRKLQSNGRPIDLAVFTGADHGMLVFDEEDGERHYTGYAEGYWPAEVESAKRLLEIIE